jgi:hypothetical protein
MGSGSSIGWDFKNEGASGDIHENKGKWEMTNSKYVARFLEGRVVEAVPARRVIILTSGSCLLIQK